MTSPREAVVVSNERGRNDRLVAQVVETLDNHSRYKMILPSEDFEKGDKLWITISGNRWATEAR